MFQVKKSDFVNELGLVAGATERRNTLPILGAIKVVVAGDQMSLAACTMEQQISATNIPVEAEGDCTFVVDAQRLLSIVKSCRDGDISFEPQKNGSSVKITSGSAKWTVPTFDPQEFASLDDSGKELEQVTLRSAELLDAISGIAWCMSDDASRINLCGIYFDQGALVATNGHVLGMSTIGYEGPAFILPSTAVKQVGKLCVSGVAEISVRLMAHDDGVPSVAVFTSGDVQFIARLVSGEFPNYRQVLPKPRSIIGVDKEPLVSAIDRVCNVADKALRAINFDIFDGEIVLSVTANDGADGRDVVKVDGGEVALESAFNAPYLRSAASCMDDKFKIGYINETAPILVSSGTRSVVVMPWRR